MAQRAHPLAGDCQQDRGGEPKRLRQSLEGDLDCIVLMAIRKEPHLRYESALAFSSDIRRYSKGIRWWLAAGRPATGWVSGSRRKMSLVTAAAVIAALGGSFGWQILARRRSQNQSAAVGGCARFKICRQAQSAWLPTALTEM
jgi:hypothetical protein